MHNQTLILLPLFEPDRVPKQANGVQIGKLIEDVQASDTTARVLLAQSGTQQSQGESRMRHSKINQKHEFSSLEAEIIALKQENAALKNQVSKLKERSNKLKATTNYSETGESAT
jgi:hypothetical protein